MDIVKAEPAGPLVKHTPPQDKIALGMSGAAMACLGLTTVGLLGPQFMVAAGIGAVLLSWESVLDSKKRTIAAVSALSLGAIPLAFFAMTTALHALIIIAILAGAGWCGSTVWKKRRAARNDGVAAGSLRDVGDDF